MKAEYSKREHEFSKVWVKKNTSLFVTCLIEFLSQHPIEEWEFNMTQTKGFFTITASLREAA